jgi:hypothetical protein
MNCLTTVRETTHSHNAVQIKELKLHSYSEQNALGLEAASFESAQKHSEGKQDAEM